MACGLRVAIARVCGCPRAVGLKLMPTSKEVQDLTDAVNTLISAMSNGGTVKLKPPTQWFSIIVFLFGLVSGTFGNWLMIRDDIQDIQHTLTSRMQDRWTASMMAVYADESRYLNRDKDFRVPDVRDITKKVPAPTP